MAPVVVTWLSQPPCLKPLVVSSSAAPGAWTTPSRLIHSFTMTLRIMDLLSVALPASRLDQAFGRPRLHPPGPRILRVPAALRSQPTPVSIIDQSQPSERRLAPDSSILARRSEERRVGKECRSR